MSGYGALAGFYDRLMRDVDYAARANYLLSLFAVHRSGKHPDTLLDLACGSGGLALEMAARGMDVVGVDASQDMLSLAAAKAAEAGMSPLWLRQDMRELDLYGTVEGAVCIMDSLNHLCHTRDLTTVFQRLFLFIEPDGLLLFDVNTPYKHRCVLGNNAFVFEEDDFLCVWRNRLSERTAMVDMHLDFFIRQGESYVRRTDFVRERAYSTRTLRRLLNDAGFETLAVYEDMTLHPPAEDSNRLLFVAKRAGDSP